MLTGEARADGGIVGPRPRIERAEPGPDGCYIPLSTAPRPVPLFTLVADGLPGPQVVAELVDRRIEL